MGKAGKISIVAGVIILFVVLIYFFGGRGKSDTYITDDWTETYDPEDRGPYGTYMLKELLDTAGMFGNFLNIENTLEEELEDNPKINDIYFFIGRTNFMEDSTAEFLLDFVEKGNTAFIAARSFPFRICQEFFYDAEYLFNNNIQNDSIQHLKFAHPDLNSKRYKFKYVFNNVTKEKVWNSFDTTNFVEYLDPPKLLGKNTKDQVNFIRFEYGDGWIYFHSIPYCFTNISMMKRDGFIYAEHMLEHIPHGRVQWDKYNLESHYEYGNDDPGGGKDRRSMLEFIMKHPPLVWALIILLIGALLYAIFKGKRMQEVIPSAELKENTSMQYVNTLSSLYMQSRSHNKLIALKEKTFLNFIAERYYILTKKADENFIDKVAVKSQVDKALINDIFNLFNQLEGVGKVTDDQLIMLHQKIEYFYKNCR